MAVFLPETISNILSHLKVYSSKGSFSSRHPDMDGLDLHHCSLVHRSWTHEAQAHLFNHVYVNWDNLRKLVNVVEISPHLRNHIRSLDVQFKEEKSGVPSASLCFRLLDQLPAVRDLKVSWHIPRTDTYGGDCPPTLPLKASGLKYVKTLELSNVVVPSLESILCACPDIRSINFWELNSLPDPWNISDDEATPTNRAPRKASRLGISLPTSGAVHRVLSGEPATLLSVPVTSLHIGGAHLMWKYYPAVHKLFRESVETITFGFGSTMQDTVPKVPHDDCTNCVFSGIQLAQFSKLTRIEFSVGPYARNWTDNMVTFGHELRHLAGPCPLKSILLNWGRTQDDYHRPPHVQEGCVGLEREKWEVFDSEAARLKIWVSCNYLVFGGNVAAAKEVVRSTLRTCLVELNRTGYLSIR